jgi:hypothetical protein
MGMLVDGEWLAEQRCSFFVGERSVLCGSVRIRVQRAYLKRALLRREETMAAPPTDSGSGVTVEIESTDCVDSHGCVPDAPDDFMPAKNENIG